MGSANPAETTQLLLACADGKSGAMDALVPHVYRELRRIAGHCMQNESPRRSIQATALVHEAYLKLIDAGKVDWRCRAHFYAVSAQIMRRILLDRARRRTAAKRGGKSPVNLGPADLDGIADVSTARAQELIALEDALEALAQVDSRKAKVVELRFFGGLSVEETAEILSISADTVMRDWRIARAWLLSELTGANSG